MWQGHYRNSIEGVAVHSSVLYNHSVAHILMRAKEDNDRNARKVIVDSVRKFIPPRSTIVPIPSSPESLRRRGFDHSLLLARAIDPRAEHVLKIIRRIEDQTELSHEERYKNLHRAYVAGNYFLPRVVLLDDVITTGSSIREALRALREVKIAPIAVISAGLASHPIPNTISHLTTGRTVGDFGQDSSRRRRSSSKALREDRGANQRTRK